MNLFLLIFDRIMFCFKTKKYRGLTLPRPSPRRGPPRPDNQQESSLSSWNSRVRGESAFSLSPSYLLFPLRLLLPQYHKKSRKRRRRPSLIFRSHHRRNNNRKGKIPPYRHHQFLPFLSSCLAHCQRVLDGILFECRNLNKRLWRKTESYNPLQL